MTNVMKKNRRPLSRSRLAAASRVAVEVMESRLFLSGSVVYSYVTDAPSYTIPAGQTATVKVYLQETLSGGATSIIDAPAEDGLLGAGFEVQSDLSVTEPASQSNIAAVNANTTDFSGPVTSNIGNTNATNSNNEGDLDEAIGTSVVTGPTTLTGSSGAAANQVYLGTVTITGAATPGTTSFQLGADAALFGAVGGTTETQAFTDLDAGNLAADGVTSFTGVGSATIDFTVTTTLPTPTVAVTAPNATYNGSAYASPTTVVSADGTTGVDDGAAVTYAYFTGTLNASQVASATPLASAPCKAGTYTVEALFAGDTTYAGGAGIANFNITPASVTVASATVAGKTYDGATTAATPTITLSGVLAADTANVTASGSAVFASAAAGSRTVNVSGITLGGSAAGNYTLASDSTTTTANISRASVTIASDTEAGKTYDGTTTAAAPTITLSGVLAADAANVTATGTAAFASAAAGSESVNVTGIALSGSASGNYSLAATTDSITATIAQKSVSVASATEAGKTYDGSTTAAAPAITLTGVVGLDLGNVTATGSAAFASAAAGSETVNITGIALGGSAAANYILAATTTSTTATIAKASVSVASATVAGKTYDGTTTAAAPTVTLSGVVGADTGNVTATGMAAFASAAAGIGVAVNISGITLAGSAAGNYTLASSTASTTANIAQATPTVHVTVNGAGTSFAATITGVSGLAGSTLDGVSLTLTYYSGSTATGTPLSGPPTVTGTYTVVATFAGSTNYAAVTTAGVSNTGTYTFSSGAPSFAQSSYTFNANETVYSYAIVGSVLATPAFSSQTISYSLSGTDAGKFEIGVASGRVQALNPLLLTGQTTFSFNVVVSAVTATHIPVTVSVPVTVNVVGVQPTITDYITSVALKDNVTDYPLNEVYVADPAIAPNRSNDVITVTMPMANGSLADPSTLANAFVGTSNGTTETYTFHGSATAATTALHYLKYTPARYEIAPGSSYATLFTVSASNAEVVTPANTAATTAHVTAANTVPVLSGVVLSQSMNDSSPEIAKTVFSSTTITDPDDGSTTFGAVSFVGQHETVTVTESNKSLGTLSGGGFTGSNGVYTFTGTAAQVTTALRALQFTPTANAILSGYPQTETLTVGVVDAAGGRASTSSNHTAIKITPVGRLTALNAALTNVNLAAPGITKVGHGTAVVTLTGVDADTKDVLTYSLATGGTNNADFYVSGNRLLVNMYAGLPVGTYSVKVKVADHGGDSVTQTLTITIGASSGSSSVALSGSATIVVA